MNRQTDRQTFSQSQPLGDDYFWSCAQVGRVPDNPWGLLQPPCRHVILRLFREILIVILSYSVLHKALPLHDFFNACDDPASNTVVVIGWLPVAINCQITKMMNWWKYSKFGFLTNYLAYHSRKPQTGYIDASFGYKVKEMLHGHGTLMRPFFPSWLALLRDLVISFSYSTF